MRKNTMKRTTAIILTCATLALAGGGIANAEPLNPDGHAPAAWPYGDIAYNAYFNTPEKWRPAGDVVADSGFRPTHHGFGFANFGADLKDHNQLFGLEKSDSGISPLTAESMVELLGPGVCIGNKQTNTTNGQPCNLKYSAELFANSIASMMGGGKCYGFSVLVAALYNGQVKPSDVDAAIFNNASQLNPELSQALSRYAFAQAFYPPQKDAENNTGANNVLNKLIEGLTPGSEPYLLVFGGPRAHAVTPYAVLDEGNGKYSIAIYDNNFPNQARAIKIDTNTNTFAYSGGSMTGDDGYVYSEENGNFISVRDVASNLGQLANYADMSIPFTNIAFSPVKKENAGIEVTVTTDGEAVEGNSPMNPSDQTHVALPVFVLLEAGNPDEKILITVDASKAVSPQDIEVHIGSTLGGRIVVLEDVLPGTKRTIQATAGSDVRVVNAGGNSVRIAQSVEDSKNKSVLGAAHLLSKGAGVAISSSVNERRNWIKYSASSAGETRWNLTMYVDSVRGRSRAADATDFRVPAGGSLLLDYANSRAVAVDRDGAVVSSRGLDRFTPGVAVPEDVYPLMGAR